MIKTRSIEDNKNVKINNNNNINMNKNNKKNNKKNDTYYFFLFIQ